MNYYYQTPDGALHQLPDPQFEHLLPPGALPITEQAAQLIQQQLNPPPTPQVPRAVTMRQAQLALLANGLLDAVDQAIAAAPRAVQIAWQTAAQVERDSPLIDALGAQLGLSTQQIDALFAEASTL